MFVAIITVDGSVKCPGFELQCSHVIKRHSSVALIYVYYKCGNANKPALHSLN